MIETPTREKWTLQQIVAIASLFIISVWSIAVFLIHSFAPLSGDPLELALIGTVAVVSLLLLPFYWKRVKWSYLGGIDKGQISFRGYGGTYEVTVIDPKTNLVKKQNFKVEEQKTNSLTITLGG